MTNPVDVLKFCPRCGSKMFFPSSGKAFQCDDCRFHFFVNPAAAVAALIFNPNGELLLTLRGIEPNKGMLDLPGGFVDPCERVEDALIREIREELDIQIEEPKFLVSYPNEYVYSGYTVFTCDLAFICRVSDFSSLTCNDDVSGYLFIKPEDVDFEKVCSNSIQNIIKFYLSLQPGDK